MLDDFVGLLGKRQDDPSVVEFIREHELDRLRDDPPNRLYIGSQANGIDLLFEDGSVLAVQIFVRPGQGFASFKGGLPFGIDADMTQTSLHSSLGPPKTSSESRSVYRFTEQALRLNAQYHDGRLIVLHLDRI